MYATMRKEDYSSSAPYMPTDHSFTGRFKLDEKVAFLLSRHFALAAFDTWFSSLFANREFHQLAIVEPDKQILFFDADRRGPSAIDIQEVLGGTVVSTALITPTYHVVFVGHQPLTTNTIATIEPEVSTRASVPLELATPHSDLLKEIIKSGLWSLRKLKPILGLSHQQIARVADGSIPSSDVASRIDELHRFYERLRRLVDGNSVAMNRLLKTPRARDGKTAEEWLQAKEFKKAFSAVMDAASPALNLSETEALPLRWYDRPSTAIEDLERHDT